METHVYVVAKRDLSAAQLAERSVAARARWAGHRAETNPTVRQSAWGEGTAEPSRSATGLFRQGMPGRARSGGLWDTRAIEPTAGQIHGRLTLHFPKAYRSARPDKAAKGEKKLLAHRLAADPSQPVAITNPGTVAQAHRHPEMRALMQGAVETVREHQKGAIAKATQNGLIPDGTPPGLVREAYKHAALLALHKAGMVDWDFRMDDHAKKAFKPLVGFMRYASRRVFDQLNVQHKGKWTAFRDEFGHEFADRRKDAAGKVRRRMRPNQEFVKVDQAWGELEKLTLADLGLNIGKAPSPGQPLPGGVQSGWLAGRLALARKEADGQRSMKILSQKQKMERHFAAGAERVKDLEHVPSIKQGQTGSTRGFDLRREGMSQPGLGLGGASAGPRIGSSSRVGQGMRIGSTQRVGSIDRVSPGLRLGQTAKFGVKQKIGATAKFGVTQRLSPFQRAAAAGALRKDTIGGQMTIGRATHLGNIRPIATPRYQNKKIQYHANPTFARPGSITRFVNSLTGISSAAMLPGPARSFRHPRRFTSHSSTSTYGGSYASTGTPTQGSAQVSVSTPNPALYQKLAPIEEALALRNAIRDAEHLAKSRLRKRVPAKFIAGAAAGAGATLLGAHAKESYDQSLSATHAVVGAAAGLGAAYLMGRTGARYVARREASRIFHSGLAAAREHLGATGDKSVFRTARRAAVKNARNHRDAAGSAWRPRRSHLAIGAGVGATASLPSNDRETT